MTPKPDGFRALDVETSLGALYSSQLGYKDKLAVSSFFFFFFFIFIAQVIHLTSHPIASEVLKTNMLSLRLIPHNPCANVLVICQCETNEFSKAKSK
jgi:hypothetical protein